MLVAFVRVFSAFYTLLLSWTVEKRIEQSTVETISQWLRIVRFLIIRFFLVFSVIFFRLLMLPCVFYWVHFSIFFCYCYSVATEFVHKPNQKEEKSRFLLHLFWAIFIAHLSCFVCFFPRLVCAVVIFVVGSTPLALSERERENNKYTHFKNANEKQKKKHICVIFMILLLFICGLLISCRYFHWENSEINANKFVCEEFLLCFFPSSARLSVCGGRWIFNDDLLVHDSR